MVELLSTIRPHGAVLKLIKNRDKSVTLQSCLNDQRRGKGSESFKRYTVITGSRASSVGTVTGSFPLPATPL
jgi:hypothetical protein